MGENPSPSGEDFSRFAVVTPHIICTKRGDFSQNLLTGTRENPYYLNQPHCYDKGDGVMDLQPDPPPPPGRSSSSCKELIHWYFLFPSASRILRALAKIFPGPSLRPALVARPGCGGTALCLLIFPVGPSPSISAVCGVPAVELCTA